MQRVVRLGGAALLALGAVFGQSVAVPQLVLACSCAGPPPALEQLVSEDANVVIVVGTLGIPGAETTPVSVEAWFHGENPQTVVVLRGGTRSMTSCDVMFTPGERRFLVLYPDPGGAYSTNICAPGALLGTPEAAQLISEAQQLFGEGTVPPPDGTPATAEPGRATPEPGGATPRLPTDEPGAETPSPETPPAAATDGVSWIVAGVAAATILFGALALLALRRPLS